MYTLNADKRDGAVKAKKLRREGIIPGSLCGGDLKEAVMFQIPEKEAAQLAREETKGSEVTLIVAGEQYHVKIKEITFCVIKNQLEDICFQLV